MLCYKGTVMTWYKSTVNPFYVKSVQSTHYMLQVYSQHITWYMCTVNPLHDTSVQSSHYVMLQGYSHDMVQVYRQPIIC